MTTRAEFVQKARAAGLDDGKIKLAMADRRTRIGAFDDDPGAAAADTTPALAPAPAAEPPPAPPAKMGFKDGLKEAARSMFPARMKYGEQHPGKNTVQGQILGDQADPTFLGNAGAWAKDAVSLPRRISGAYGAAIEGQMKGQKPAEYYNAVKSEMQKTEGAGFLENVEREMPLMLIPGGPSRTAGTVAKMGARAAESAAPKVAEGALPLKEWIAEAADKIPQQAADAAKAVPGMATKVLGGIKRMGPDLMARMGRGAAETAPQAAYHQLQSHTDTGAGNGAGGALELGIGAAAPAGLKVLGGVTRMVPQGAKWLMSQMSGANQRALQRASEKGGVQALKAAAGDEAANQLADELITSLGRKEELLHPEPKLAAEIVPKLPPVQAVEPKTRRNTVAMAGGKEIPIDFTPARMEPMRQAGQMEKTRWVGEQPSLKDQADLEKLGRPPGEGLPTGNPKYEAAATQFRREAAERTEQAATLSQTVKQALRSVGKKIYVSDAMRSQLGLSGNNWKRGASEFGLDMLTSNKAEGMGLDRAAAEIGVAQANGRWAGLPKIENESDLLDALYESTVKKTRGRGDLDKFLEEAIKTGENLGEAQMMPAGDLKKGDIFTVGGSLFKVVKHADGQVIVDGPAKHILDAKERVYFDPGSRIGNEGETFSAPLVGESMDIPEQGKVDFLKTLTHGRERFRDLLEEKTKETVRTPEKEKTLGKLRSLLDMADEQLQGSETLSAQEALNFKRDYQDVLKEQYKSRDSDEYFNTYKKLAHSLRTGIEEAAEKSGNPEYITIMRSLANKLQAIDAVETRFVGDQITKGQDRAARQIKIITNDAQRPALRELTVLDKLFGTNFAERAKDIGYAKMLNMSEEGIPLLPLHTTGKALMGASALGGAYNAGEGNVNPFAVAGLLLSSPRMAVYAFKGLDIAAAAAPRIGKTLGAALPRLQSTAVYGANKETGSQ